MVDEYRPVRLSAVAMAISFAAALGTGAVTPAMAQDDATLLAQSDARHRFDIAPQPLTDAIALFSEQANMQISAHGDLVREVRTGGVSGTMTGADALQRLLAGTGLVYRITNDGAIIHAPGTGQESSGPMRLGTIVVESGAMQDEHALAADRASSIGVSAADLERRRPRDLRDVFKGESAVSVGNSIPSSQKLYVHGVEETNLAVSIDGVRQNNKVFHHNGTTLIDPSLLKQALVDPGVAPADAGPAAMGGSVVYETVDVGDVLSPDRNVGGFTTLSFDTDSETFTNGYSAYGRHEGFEGLGFFKFAKGDEVTDGNGEFVNGSESDVLSGLAKLGYESDEGHRFEVFGERVRDSAKRPFRANIGRLTTGTNPVTRQYTTNRENYGAQFSMPHADGLFDPEIVVGYSGTELKVPVPFGSIGETTSLSAKVQNDFNLSEGNTITVGTDFYDDKARYYDPGVDMHESSTNAGVYGQARLTPMEDFRVSFGLRGDYQIFEGVDGSDLEQSGTSGNVSAAYDILDHVTVKAGYSRVWGGVALSENFIMNQNWDYTDGIEPVTSKNYTSGLEFNYEGFSAGAGIFRSDFKNVRDPSFNGGPGVVTDFRTQGYDLSLGYDWGAGFARATYTDSRIKVEGNYADSFTTNYLGMPLGKIIALEVAHRFDGLGLTLGGTMDAALTNRDTELAGSEKQNSYKVFSSYAEYEPEDLDFLTLRVEANNILDEVYSDRATYGQEFSTVEPLREQGRSFLLWARAEF